ELSWEITTGREPVPEGAPEGTEGEPIKEERRANFTVVVKDVKRKELPAVDDAFARSVGEYESVDGMRNDVRRRLYGEALRAARTATENKAVDAAIEKATFEVPERLLEAETEALAQERRQALAQQRIALERYLQIMGTSEEEWRGEIRQQAERQLKARLLLDQLAEQEKIEVDPQSVAEEIERTAASYGAQADQVRRSLRADEGMRRVTTSLRRHQAIQSLVERAGGYPPDELGVLSDESAAGSDAAASTADAEREPASVD
ncbi:MAG TPA: hypothetical protein VFX49_02190, partial [Chloroflexota bacterium]|nr:hypothetical protein [Chloroflexota bacterium]